nr:immunoglobulin heavy chain junction region [Macaca mulatta]MOV47444.1 immunoglobulin heavy chain junction region [Macaca mulatta]MOV47911.1 immunoglobulin heavy chain junction region [Macaca mulatta]MOV48012.1 immunoglobulin heavy chain junction region [Macaca mulatta]MOV48013.1 immunoglobulin heavy chain junction region [Macaca mulatta]
CTRECSSTNCFHYYNRFDVW